MRVWVLPVPPVGVYVAFTFTFTFAAFLALAALALRVFFPALLGLRVTLVDPGELTVAVTGLIKALPAD